MGEAVFDTHAFYQTEFPYRVTYASENTFLDSAWTVDNFYKDDHGNWTPKRGTDYEAPISVDLNGDSVGDQRIKVPIYDLKLIHSRNDAVIWLSTIALPARWAETDLSVLAHSYVETAAGSGFVVTSLGDVEEHRYATRTLAERPTQIGSIDAYEITFEVANVDQLELSRTSRSRNARVLLVRPPYLWRVSDSDIPVLMVLGLSARPEHFDASVPAFDQLINRVDIGYDRYLDQYEARVLACVGDGLPVSARIEIDAQGLISGVEVAGTVAGGAAGRHSYAAQQCIRKLLLKEPAVAIGRPRAVTWRFGRAPTSTASTPTAYQGQPLAASTTPTASETPGPSETTTPPAPSATPTPTPTTTPRGAEVAETPAAPVPEVPPEVALRTAVDAERDGILACVDADRLALTLVYGSGQVTVKLRAPYKGKPEEACVQHVLRSLATPATTSGTLIHVVR